MKVGDRVRIKYGWCDGMIATITELHECAAIVHYNPFALFGTFPADHAVQYGRIEAIR